MPKLFIKNLGNGAVIRGESPKPGNTNPMALDLFISKRKLIIVIGIPFKYNFFTLLFIVY